jgi:NADPH-dependent 2,4-dienoyl-CoA reductase/sulfur reductase-like enzyme/Fe-S-cluster-containing hydrogenase component 2
MEEYRIKRHPILPIPERRPIEFYWRDQKLNAYEGETIASALIANGIRIFGHHPKDGSPQGIFCANGQCAQCMVLAGQTPVKSCVELVKQGLRVNPVEGLPVLPLESEIPRFEEITALKIPVLIIGGGPAGLSAAIELGKLGIQTVLIDDKHHLGGKLVLQTHRFFGSTNAVYAGTRGIDIATRLAREVSNFPSVQIWLQSTALAVFSDQKVGILKQGREYVIVKPEVLLVAAGAREKFLAFSGNTLPGVYGAGAFQTLVNRDLVRPSKKLFIVGGGNVGLIAGYHALQAGIQVVGVVEALAECGGYKVHKDKLARLGVPIYTSHTILSANGSDQVESITIAQLDANFKAASGSEQTFECDCILIAVGLDPVDEFYLKAREYEMAAFAAGDAEEIAEASAAIFSGKIKGYEIARHLGYPLGEVPVAWRQSNQILKSKPGRCVPEVFAEISDGAMPVIHCTQEIPCDPCSSLCINGLIYVDAKDIRKLPQFQGDAYSCGCCEECVTGCPGLAITLVDFYSDSSFPTVSIPFEIDRGAIKPGEQVTLVDTQGKELGKLEVQAVHDSPSSDRTQVIQVKAPAEYARKIAGIRIQDELPADTVHPYDQAIENETIICRCERVSAGEIRSLIARGYRDINEIKTVTRAGMGACGSKTCNALIYRLFREEGVPFDEIVEQTKRPLFIEIPLGALAGESPRGEDKNE